MADRDDHERRLSTNEADIANMKGVVIEIKGYLKENAEAQRDRDQTRQQNHSEIIQRLTAIETTSAATKESLTKYQTDCDMDRKEMKAHINSLERGESRQAGKTSIINAIIGAVTGIIGGVIVSLLGGKHQ